MVGSWIFKENLESFLEMLAWIAGCPFDDWDYDAVVNGVDGTNDETDKWFEYELRGNKRLVSFRIADDPGSSVYHFQITVPNDAIDLVEFAYFVAEGHDLTRHNSFRR